MTGQERDRIPVAVLGATGAVGQTFLRLLDGHPHFRVAEVAASERSAGLPYAQATVWRESAPPPPELEELTILPCDPASVRSAIVFSALDAAVAGEIEAAFAEAGRVVLSNARNYRMEADVPLVVPEVNGDHLGLIDAQRRLRGWPGAIVTNANCATTVAALALAPLHEAFGLRHVFAATMQAVSGAGYPGVASMDILGNVIPFISGEEEKIEHELPKLLGSVTGSRATPADISVSAHANRVPVADGHTICLSASFEETPTAEQAAAAYNTWSGRERCRGLPSAPPEAIVVRTEEDRPQVRRDVGTGGGMSVVVGRLRGDGGHLRLVAMGHNTVRGAAGGSVLNAELMGRMGLLPGVAEGSW